MLFLSEKDVVGRIQERAVAVWQLRYTTVLVCGGGDGGGGGETSGGVAYGGGDGYDDGEYCEMLPPLSLSKASLLVNVSEWPANTEIYGISYCIRSMQLIWKKYFAQIGITSNQMKHMVKCLKI